MSLTVSSPEKNPLDAVMNSLGARKNVLDPTEPIYPRSLYEMSFEGLTGIVGERTTAAGHPSTDRWNVLGRGWERMGVTRQRRLIRNLSDAIGMSYFGGMGGLGLCLNMICWEVNKHIDIGNAIHVRVSSECENDVNKQRLLLAYEGRHRPMCLFGNILARLPADVQGEVNDLKPATNILKDAKLMANKKVKRIIADAYLFRGAECNYSKCIIHDRACPVDPPPDARYVRNRSGRQRHRVRLGAGGVPCVDHSSHGNQEGAAGGAAPAHAAYFADIKHRRFSVVFTECTPHWDAEPAAQEIHSVYLGCETVLDPRLIGDSYSRRRRLMTSFNKEEAGVREHVYVV